MRTVWLEYVLVAILGGGTSFVLTRLGYSLLRSLFTLIWLDGVGGVWRDFITSLLWKPEASFTDIFCVLAGVITAIYIYTAHHVPKYEHLREYRHYVMFWVPIAGLIYILKRIPIILSMPKRLADLPADVMQELLFLNVFSMFSEMFAFMFSLIAVIWLFGRHGSLVESLANLLTRDLKI